MRIPKLKKFCEYHFNCSAGLKVYKSTGANGLIDYYTLCNKAVKEMKAGIYWKSVIPVKIDFLKIP